MSSSRHRPAKRVADLVKRLRVDKRAGAMLEPMRSAARLARHSPRYRRTLAINAVTVFGFVVACGQLILWISGATRFNRTTSLIALAVVAVVFLLTAVRTLPAKVLSVVNSQSGATITAKQDDLFDCSDGPIVVTVNTHFDTARTLVSEHSLIDQLIRYRHAGDVTPVHDALQLAKLEAGSLNPVGSIAFVPDDRGGAILLAVASRDDHAVSATVVEDVIAAEAALWAYARANNLTQITVPVIASGFTRARPGPLPLLLLLVTSYVMSHMDHPVCPVRIVLPEALDVISAVEILDAYTRAHGFVRSDASTPWWPDATTTQPTALSPSTR